MTLADPPHFPFARCVMACMVTCIWVPDTRSPKFAAECRRQSLSIARGPEAGLESFLEAAAQEIEGWK